MAAIASMQYHDSELDDQLSAECITGSIRVPSNCVFRKKNDTKTHFTGKRLVCINCMLRFMQGIHAETICSETVRSGIVVANILNHFDLGLTLGVHAGELVYFETLQKVFEWSLVFSNSSYLENKIDQSDPVLGHWYSKLVAISASIDTQNLGLLKKAAKRHDTCFDYVLEEREKLVSKPEPESTVWKTFFDGVAFLLDSNQMSLDIKYWRSCVNDGINCDPLITRLVPQRVEEEQYTSSTTTERISHADRIVGKMADVAGLAFLLEKEKNILVDAICQTRWCTDVQINHDWEGRFSEFAWLLFCFLLELYMTPPCVVCFCVFRVVAPFIGLTIFTWENPLLWPATVEWYKILWCLTGFELTLFVAALLSLLKYSYKRATECWHDTSFMGLFFALWRLYYIMGIFVYYYVISIFLQTGLKLVFSLFGYLYTVCKNVCLVLWNVAQAIRPLFQTTQETLPSTDISSTTENILENVASPPPYLEWTKKHQQQPNTKTRVSQRHPLKNSDTKIRRQAPLPQLDLKDTIQRSRENTAMVKQCRQEYKNLQRQPSTNAIVSQVSVGNKSVTENRGQASLSRSDLKDTIQKSLESTAIMEQIFQECKNIQKQLSTNAIVSQGSVARKKRCRDSEC